MSLRTRFILITVLLAGAAPAPALAQASTVIVVRHAEKRADQGSDPELMPAGTARAAALASALRDARVATIFVTEFRRNALTAAPLAAARGLVPVVVPVAGDREAHGRAIAAAVRRLPRGSVALVVEHSNTVPQVVAALGGPRLPDLADAEHATMFVVSVGSGKVSSLIRATYGAADSLGATAASPTGSGNR